MTPWQLPTFEMSRRPRGLRPEEEKLWNRVRDTVTPLGGAKKYPLEPEPNEGQTPEPAFKVPAFRVGERAQTALPPAAGDHPLRIDKKTFARMKRGKSAPEGRIDLHGMTADAAQAALTAYLLRAQQNGKRLILVITGKGKDRDDGDPVPQRGGVLRRNLPMWLSRPPLNGIVLQHNQAHQRHGGSGAFYVYLRRNR